MTEDIDVSGGWELNRREECFTFSDEEMDLLEDNGYLDLLENDGYFIFCKGLIASRVGDGSFPIPEDNQYFIRKDDRNAAEDPQVLNALTSILGPGRIV